MFRCDVFMTRCPTHIETQQDSIERAPASRPVRRYCRNRTGGLNFRNYNKKEMPYVCQTSEEEKAHLRSDVCEEQHHSTTYF